MFLLVIRVVLLPIQHHVLTRKNSIGLMQLRRSIYCMVEVLTLLASCQFKKKTKFNMQRLQVDDSLN